MMKALENLSTREKALVFKAPVFVSVLAASIDGIVDAKEKKEAIHLSHLRTFTSDPALQDYYKVVERTFENDFDLLHNSIPAEVEERKAIIQAELEKLNEVLNKVDKKFADLLRHSLKTYADHILKIHHNALEFFILPSVIQGMTD